MFISYQFPVIDGYTVRTHLRIPPELALCPAESLTSSWQNLQKTGSNVDAPAGSDFAAAERVQPGIPERQRLPLAMPSVA